MDLDEVFNIAVPVVEHATCQSGSGVQIMLANQFVKFLARDAVFNQRELHHIHVAEVVETVVGVVDVGDTARHAGGEVSAGLAEHDNASAGHILAAVVAGALDDGYGAGIADAEAFAHLTVDIQFAGGGAIEAGVAGDDIVLCAELFVAAGRR